MLGWLWASSQHEQGTRGLTAAAACLACVVVTFLCTSAAHSLVLMTASWVTVFALCSVLSSLYSMTITHKPMDKFSYGLARVPVLAVFSTTVLAQLFSIFLSKEAFEHLLAPDHHGSGGHDHDGGHSDHGKADSSLLWPFYLGALSSSVALLISAYSLKSQPFQHVLTAATASSLQEHAADISSAICFVVPGLARLLLPRINAMVLLAGCTSTLVMLCEHFKQDFAWADPVCCVLLCVSVFSTMWPLSTYTGRILLQTAPPHLLNQLDRCISEASTIDGVLELKAGHFWQLDFAQMVGTVDVRVRRDADEQNVLALVADKLSGVVNLLTVQVVKDAAWQSHDAVASSGYGSQPLSSSAHGHSHDDGDHHGHSHDDHGGHGHSHNDGGHGHSHDTPSNGYGSPPTIQQHTSPFAYQPPQPPSYAQSTGGYSQAYTETGPRYSNTQGYATQNYSTPAGGYGMDHGHSHENGGHGHSHDEGAGHGHSHSSPKYD